MQVTQAKHSVRRDTNKTNKANLIHVGYFVAWHVSPALSALLRAFDQFPTPPPPYPPFWAKRLTHPYTVFYLNAQHLLTSTLQCQASQASQPSPPIPASPTPPFCNTKPPLERITLNPQIPQRRPHPLNPGTPPTPKRDHPKKFCAPQISKHHLTVPSLYTVPTTSTP